MGADKSAEHTPNSPKLICPNCLPKPKSLGFWRKKGLHWASVVHSWECVFFKFLKKTFLVLKWMTALYKSQADFHLDETNSIFLKNKNKMSFFNFTFWRDFCHRQKGASTNKIVRLSYKMPYYCQISYSKLWLIDQLYIGEIE